MSKKNMQYIDVANDFTEEEEAVFKPAVAVAEPAKGAKPEKTEAVGSSLDSHVAAQYRAGMNLKDICKSNNISAGKVYGILARMDVPLRSGRYKTASGDRLATMTNKEKQSLIDSYLSGKALETLYRAYNLNKHGLYRVLDEANIPRRHKHISTEAKPETEEAAYTGVSPEEFTGTLPDGRLTTLSGGQTFPGIVAEPVEKPVVADVSATDTGIHITLNRKHLTSAENINITITVAG